MKKVYFCTRKGLKSLQKKKTKPSVHVTSCAEAILTNELTFIDRVENIVGKGENIDYLHFLLFQQFGQRDSMADLEESSIFWLTLPNGKFLDWSN